MRKSLIVWTLSVLFGLWCLLASFIGGFTYCISHAEVSVSGNAGYLTILGETFEYELEVPVL